MSNALNDFLSYFEQDVSQNQPPYPWALTAEAIAPELESEIRVSPEEEADLNGRSERFFASLTTLVDAEAGRTIATTVDELLTRLSQWLPRERCLEIVKICQAKCLMATDYSEQLTLAIADLLPQWNSDDRQLLLRPYAVAFRSRTEPRHLGPEADKVWDEMSVVEQGQYLVAIADFVLTELNNLDLENP